MSIRAELSATLRLAGPLALASAGQQFLSLTDTVVAGHLSAEALAAVGLGGSIYFGATVLGLGILMGLDPLASQAFGRGDPGAARRHLSEAVRLAIALAIPGLLLMGGAARPVMDLIGVEAATQAGTLDYLRGRGPSIFPLLMSVALQSYLQAAQRPRAVLLATLGANLTNIPLDLVLGFGDEGLGMLGLPAMGLGVGYGVAGLGAASTAVQTVRCAVLGWAVHRLARPPGTGGPRWEGVRALLRVGLPVGFHFLAEAGAFVGVTILAGALGTIPLAGHQVALNLASFTFTVCLGISAATAVRVGRAVGRGDAVGMRRAGFLGAALGVGFMCCSATVFALTARPLASLVSEDLAVVEAAIPLLWVAAAFQVFDGLQVVGAGALRGASDTRAGMVLGIIGHWVIGMPLGAVLAFGFAWGVVGLWVGLTGGLMVASVGMILRFHWTSSRAM
jgi:multidrug resistance protein, MATE family